MSGIVGTHGAAEAPSSCGETKRKTASNTNFLSNYVIE